jgi:ribonuclease HI
MRALPLHECHGKLKTLKNHYAEEITSTKKQHWIEWLEDIEGNDLWTANRYVSSDPRDGGKVRIPSLKKKNPDGTTTEANSNQEKSVMIAESFFPLPPNVDSVPTDIEYPDPIAPHSPITSTQISRAIAKLSGYKAPGPDGICNIVFKQCGDILSPYLVHLFNAVFTHKTYYDPWRSFTTVVLRKPGKPDYTVPKAYRPIALLNSTPKLLTAIVAEELTFLLEHHKLLPNTHFGGRPGRSTTDSLHLLEETIKNAWRSHKVASVLFLDIEGAFPNAVTKRLLHNMRMRRLPLALIEFTERVLANRRTQLRFDDHLSDWIPITNGIGQGDPLSMILYIIYNSDLVDVAKPRMGREALRELTLAFVDDTAFVAIAPDFETAHNMLVDMMTRPGGGYDWSRDHNSRFETNKFALMDFSMNRHKERPNLLLQGITIKPAQSHRFLGVILDQELRWNKQVDNAIARGTAYVLQLRRLSAATKGIPMKLMRQLYQAIAVPKMLYAADLWFSPVYRDGSDTLQRGSMGVAKKLTTIQRIAALAITGAMRSTATDLLEIHANLLPVTLLLQNTCHRAIVRLTALPDSHPLHPHVRRAARRFVSSHRSSLHRLTHHFAINPNDIESLIPARRPPHSANPYSIHIAPDKNQAIEVYEQLTDRIQVFSDGSGHNGHIGAAAVLFRAGNSPRVLWYHLGTEEEHTVFEAEEVGLTLAAKLISSERDLHFPISILVDNQASIQSGESFYSSPGSYLADKFRRMMNRIAKDNRDFDITVRWIPGHSDVHGNEEADKQAKRAAESRMNDSSRQLLPHYLQREALPLSISALKQMHDKQTRAHWGRLWRKSPRYARTNRIDPNLMQRSFIKLAANFPKRLTSLYISLHSQHISLNKHLHRLGKVESPHCAHCPQIDETVHHCHEFQILLIILSSIHDRLNLNPVPVT